VSILVICPSRNRPAELADTASTLVKTRRHGSTQLLAVVDPDDMDGDRYVAGANMLYHYMFPEHAGGMVNALNAAAKHVLEEWPDVTILGFVGDDHKFRTLHWDEQIEQALATPGFAYGYDGFWHKGEIPTQIFISREIVVALGYMALPDLRHLYVDNAWRALADRLDVLHYLPEVYIEHMHPAIGKAEWDDGHKRVNAPEMYERDRAAFEKWQGSSRFNQDVRRVRRAIKPTTVKTLGGSP
jgi:hypothetical protein